MSSVSSPEALGDRQARFAPPLVAALIAIAGCDGVRVDYEDWWFCVRPSGTEPIARLALEARTEEMLERRTGILSDTFVRLA